MKPRPKPHSHYFLIEGTGSQVPGKCACGETRFFDNSFSAAISTRFGKGKWLDRSTLITNLASQSKALREAVSMEAMPLDREAEHFSPGR